MIWSIEKKKRKAEIQVFCQPCLIANPCLYGSGFFWLALFFYVVYSEISIPDRTFSSVSSMYVWHALPLAAGGLSLTALRLPQRHRNGVVIGIAIAVLLSYAAELYAVLSRPRLPTNIWGGFSPQPESLPQSLI
jgi:hypothetical protein